MNNDVSKIIDINSKSSADIRISEMSALHDSIDTKRVKT